MAGKEKHEKTYPMRPACIEAGYCLNLTREPDCNLFPAGYGLCQARVQASLVDQVFEPSLENWENTQS
jgi:hypothetical protein